MKRIFFTTTILIFAMFPMISAAEGRAATPQSIHQGVAASEEPLYMPHENGLFVTLQLGGAYTRPFERSSKDPMGKVGFCDQRWATKHCHFTNRNYIGLSGELALGYRLMPYLSLLVGFHGTTLEAPRMKTSIPEKEIKTVLKLSYIMSAELSARFYPLLIQAPLMSRKSHGFYLGAGGGYTWMRFGNELDRSIEQKQKFHIKAFTGYEYPVTTRAVLGIQAGFNYSMPPMPFFNVILMGSIGYYFF